jgi:predicted ATPase
VRAALVGRDAELGEFRAGLDAALTSRPRVMVCRGEPGIGKTRLAEELCELARERGAAVAWGSGIDGVGAPPLWPWTQVLRAVAARFDLTALAAGLGLTDDLAGVAPDVVGVPRPAALHAATGEERFRQFDAVARLLGRVSEQEPLVVVVDDAHWADRPSMLLIRHLARTLTSERLLLVVTLRSTGNAHATDVAELLREPATRQVELAGLSVAAVAEQLAAVTGQPVDTAEAAQVHALTGGNPFFVLEVGRVLPAAGSAARLSR